MIFNGLAADPKQLVRAAIDPQKANGSCSTEVICAVRGAGTAAQREIKKVLKELWQVMVQSPSYVHKIQYDHVQNSLLSEVLQSQLLHLTSKLSMRSVAM